MISVYIVSLGASYASFRMLSKQSRFLAARIEPQNAQDFGWNLADKPQKAGFGTVWGLGFRGSCQGAPTALQSNIWGCQEVCRENGCLPDLPKYGSSLGFS